MSRWPSITACFVFCAASTAAWVTVTKGCLALFAAWKTACKPAEFHVYDQVGAGFGMNQSGLPVDIWTDRLYDWMLARDLTSLRNVGSEPD
jgi:hypothetical protein